MTTLNRAYSLFHVKQIDDDARIITGMASTPTPDRLSDVVVSEGARYKLPMPLLWQHDSRQPIGHVIAANISKAGIQISAQIAKGVTPEIDRAWALIKAGLVKGLSIGFRPLEREYDNETGGIHFKVWEWLELSAVTIPANSEASIQTVKSIIEAAQQAASGQQLRSVVSLKSPGVAGSAAGPKEAPMPTIAEQITKLEAKRAASAAAREAVMTKTAEEERTSSTTEQEEFDKHSEIVKACDADLSRLYEIEAAKAKTARPVIKAVSSGDGSEARSSSGNNIIVRGPPKLPPGIAFAQRVKCLILSQRMFMPPGDIALQMYGADSQVAIEFKAPVPAGTTLAGNWAVNLIGEETGSVADFIEWLRPQTILGRFGNDGIPALRPVMFRTPIISQTSGGQGYWVGEGKAKPLTKFDFARTTLEPLKVANICALTEESIRYSSPKADALVRDGLGGALRERLDTDFINPAKTAVAGVSPASVTNGAESIVSAGDDADDVRIDIRSAWAKYTAENNPPSSGVWIMSSNTAVALAMMNNPLGQAEFPGMGMAGGMLSGMPVIASDYVGDIVVLLNASDIFLADDGEISIDASREASLEMSDAPTHNSGTPTAASLVSMWQTNSVAIRAERVINWMRRRDPAVVVITSVGWGGPVNTA